MSIKVTGLDKLQRELADIQRRAKSLDGEHSVPLTELLPPSFMRQNTPYPTLESLLESSGLRFENEADFEQLKTPAWDTFIAQHTKFASWQDLLNAGAADYARRQIFG